MARSHVLSSIAVICIGNPRLCDIWLSGPESTLRIVIFPVRAITHPIGVTC